MNDKLVYSSSFPPSFVKKRKGWEQAAVGGVGAALCGRPLPTVGSCGQPDPERSEGMRPKNLHVWFSKDMKIRFLYFILWELTT